MDAFLKNAVYNIGVRLFVQKHASDRVSPITVARRIGEEATRRLEEAAESGAASEKGAGILENLLAGAMGEELNKPSGKTYKWRDPVYDKKNPNKELRAGEWAEIPAPPNDPSAPGLGDIVARGGGSLAARGLGDVLSGPLKGLGAGLGKHLEKMVGPAPEFMDRRDVPAVIGQQLIQAGTKGVADLGAKAVGSLASGISKSIKDRQLAAQRAVVLQQVMAQDPVVSQADPSFVMDSFETMARFAPTLSTDRNAVRNFLREAVSTGSGPHFSTIKMLGETERVITNRKKED